MELTYCYQEWLFRETFKISRSASTASRLFVAYVRDGDLIGRGECGILPQYGETQADVAAGLEAARDLIAGGITREELPRSVPNSSVRNALDCALWDLECKREERSIWDLIGVARRDSLECDLTISVNPVEKMCADATRALDLGYRILKLKADKTDVIERVSAIAASAPGVRLIVDANEAWDIETLRRVDQRLAELGVVLIEQPLPHQNDATLASYRGPVPICADESCRDITAMPLLAERYQAINIKLDKVGGLTAGLELAQDAKARGMELMLGSNGPTSLGAAPGYVLSTFADHIDMDGPPLLLEDRAHAMLYRDGRMHCFTERLWG